MKYGKKMFMVRNRNLVRSSLLFLLSFSETPPEPPSPQDALGKPPEPENTQQQQPLPALPQREKKAPRPPKKKNQKAGLYSDVYKTAE